MVVNDAAHVRHAAVAYFHVVLVKNGMEMWFGRKCSMITLRKVLATLVWTFLLYGVGGGGLNQIMFLFLSLIFIVYCKSRLSRAYWVHTSKKVYKRRTITLEDHTVEVWPVIILQYSNAGKEDDLKVKPHQNFKKSCQPYYATARGTKHRISEKAKSSLRPSSTFDELYKLGGGLLECTSFASLPRAINQVKYQRTKFRKQHAKDNLAELIEKCKQSKGEFLHSLRVSLEMRFVLATKAQFADLVKSCCNPDDFSAFSVDVTYDIGTSVS